MIILRLQLS